MAAKLIYVSCVIYLCISTCYGVTSETPIEVDITTVIEGKLDNRIDSRRPFESMLKSADKSHQTFCPEVCQSSYCKNLVGVSKDKSCPIKKLPERGERTPKNCKEIFETGNVVSGIYEILPHNKSKPIMVLCDMELQGGGWTHIQNRFDGSEDFYRNWRDYKFGFGNLEGEFWIGLETIYYLTAFEDMELLVELTDKNDVKYYANYGRFSIGPELEGYILKAASPYSGTAGDNMDYHLGQKFTTKDLDQDKWPQDNCANFSMGGWWYNNCYSSNPNGQHRNMKHTEDLKRKGMNWDKISTPDGYFLYGTRMLVRPKH
ncbi:microfibril-associated glycoprotein 4-like [Diabrotica undecimpunctata]|uniref:microfibril-associated glycoprotein 4-like n=1 Tax=Diabrotica undecimpunctata TaxID=50387 RepID=UPI003B633C5B